MVIFYYKAATRMQTATLSTDWLTAIQAVVITTV